MSILEAILLSGLGVMLLFLLTPASLRPRIIYWLPVFNGFILFLHLLLDGARWQMGPAYVLALVSLPSGIRKLRYYFRPWLAWQMEDNSLLRSAVAVISAFFLLDALFLIWIAPVFRMPEPTGPYGVGTRFYHMIDTSREELLTPQSGDFRTLSAQVWYPAETVEGYTLQPYLETSGGVSAAYARFMGMPSFVFSHMSRISTHAYRDAPAFPDRFPVLIFSHAYNGNITQNTILMEQLASHGYIVFSIGHPYETPFIFDAEGKPILYEPDNPGRISRLEEIDDPIAGRIRSQIIAANIPGGQRRLYQKLLNSTPLLMESVRIWSDDIRVFTNHLEDLGAEDPLYGRLDMEKVGALGHSMGGAASGQFCLIDERCQAGLNMDGFQYGDLLQENLNVPFMFMYSALPEIESSRFNHLFYQDVENDAYSIVIKSTTHANFSDLPLYFQDYRLEQRLQQIEPARGMEIVTAYTLAFFDRYLKDIDSPLLHGPSSAFPEVIMESHGS